MKNFENMINCRANTLSSFSHFVNAFQMVWSWMRRLSSILFDTFSCFDVNISSLSFMSASENTKTKKIHSKLLPATLSYQIIHTTYTLHISISLVLTLARSVYPLLFPCFNKYFVECETM